MNQGKVPWLNMDEQSKLPGSTLPKLFSNQHAESEVTIRERNYLFAYAVHPPSVANVPPVKLDASSLRRNSITAACSQTVDKRLFESAFINMDFSFISFAIVQFSFALEAFKTLIAFIMLVSIGAMLTEFTRIPYAA
ncbi:hypothetical protein M513_10833 [Trichuris suis]|uniref:Uncharacterized protein n=1 Tax=Trichuris suis TaxID=68888 RepID=A0A085LTG0_9BILA|nr:hypothetical protein M513_10833 [Trichuris suis]